jgi:hypothetical protein
VWLGRSAEVVHPAICREMRMIYAQIAAAQGLAAFLPPFCFLSQQPPSRLRLVVAHQLSGNDESLLFDRAQRLLGQPTGNRIGCFGKIEFRGTNQRTRIKLLLELAQKELDRRTGGCSCSTTRTGRFGLYFHS